jgi:signal transduction histidine kinase
MNENSQNEDLLPQNTVFIDEQQKIDAILVALTDGVTMQDTNYRILYQNEAHQARQGDQKGKYCYKAYQGRDDICPGCLLRKSFADGLIHRRENVIKNELGVTYHEISSSPIRDEQGNIVAAIEILRDITAQKKLEQQLLQSQKMEAIGRLTGGISHDFNNLLTVIMGYSEIVMTGIAEDNALYAPLHAINDAGNKASQLTKQLLAFSRKQQLEMKPLNLNKTLADMTKILARMIGEDIELKLENKCETAKICADETQLAQIFMNLAINARDAMPNGGTLSMETSRVELDNKFVRQCEGLQAGSYIKMIVSDTGIGMSNETKNKIFEPFFTTKETGKGTGLGLSTVYGIVKQHNGYIVVYSEPGLGTSFKIYFPETRNCICSVHNQSEPVEGGTETILVVDDENTICDLIESILQPLGYTILKANGWEEAVKISAEQGQKIDLLLVDVIMPKVNGRQLAEQLCVLNPALAVIYMSGYSKNIIAGRGIISDDVAYLAKPIFRKKLTRKIREVLAMT